MYHICVHLCKGPCIYEVGQHIRWCYADLATSKHLSLRHSVLVVKLVNSRLKQLFVVLRLTEYIGIMLAHNGMISWQVSGTFKGDIIHCAQSHDVMFDDILDQGLNGYLFALPPATL